MTARDTFATVVSASKQLVVGRLTRALPLPPLGTMVCIGPERTHAVVADAGELSGPVGDSAELIFFKLDSGKTISRGASIDLMPESEIQQYAFDMRFIKTLLESELHGAEDVLVWMIRRIANVYPEPDSYLLAVARYLAMSFPKKRLQSDQLVTRTRSHAFSSRKNL